MCLPAILGFTRYQGFDPSLDTFGWIGLVTRFVLAGYFYPVQVEPGQFQHHLSYILWDLVHLKPPWIIELDARKIYRRPLYVLLWMEEILHHLGWLKPSE